MKFSGVMEGALLSALSFILYLMALIPGIGGLISVFSGLPLIAACFRLSFKNAFTVLLVSTLLAGQFTGIPGAVIYFSFYGAGGLATGYFLKKNCNPSFSLFLTSLIMMMIFQSALLLLPSSAVSDFSGMSDRLSEKIEENRQFQLSELSEKIPSDNQKKQFIEIFYSSYQKMLRLFSPALFLFASIFFSTVYYLSGQYFTARFLNVKTVEFKHYSLPWKFVFTLVFPLLVFEIIHFRTGAGFLSPPEGDIGKIHFLSVNMLVSSMLFYFLQGIAIIDFYLSKNSRSRLMLPALMFFSVLFVPLLILLVMTGVFDCWYDFRKLEGGENESNSA